MGLGQSLRKLIFKPDAVSDQEQRASNLFTLLNDQFGVWFNKQNNESSDSSLRMNARRAMHISTVFTCVLVRAESLSTLPASVHQATETGSRKAYEHSVYRLIHDRPNPFNTASDYWKSVSIHIDLHGNCFSIVTYSDSWRPERIDLIPDPWNVEILKTAKGEAQYRYTYKNNKGETVTKDFEDFEILHFKDLSLDGYYGCSKIKFNAETLGYADKLRAFGSNSIGKRAEGFFTTANTFDVLKKQQESLQEGWTNAIAAGKVPFLPLGLDYKKLQITPAEALYLDAINATKEDIYGMFRIPPTLAQNYDRATFANAEQQALVFVTHTMLPMISNIEQECNAKLFAETNKTSRTPYYVKFNVNAFLRGDFKSRAEGYRTLFNIGAINGDKIAELEDWDKWEGGDVYYVPLNVIDVKRAQDFYKTLIDGKPTLEGSDDKDSEEDKAKRMSNIAELIRMNGYEHPNTPSPAQGIIYNNKN